MIIKIWPIKADYSRDKSKSSGEKGLKNALDYIMDAEKVMVNRDELRALEDPSEEAWQEYDGYFEQDNNPSRVLNYMANEDKSEGKYISGYLCNPQLALSDFACERQLDIEKAGIKREKETGALAFHIVQSFPPDLDISDEEVHQCGLELCQRIGAHQAVVCSHVHPTTDEMDGEVHGKCKHNHILINAYIHSKNWDPRHPTRIKYNDSKASYAQLRAWNDEIAIEHGLPIIRNPDDERLYSWIENVANNKGLSWKERMRNDIEEARRATDTWDKFKAKLEQQGYKINDNVKHITYTAPDGIHVARGKTLGREYKREGIELYWNIRKYGYKEIETSLKDNDSPPLSVLAAGSQTTLKAAVPIGTKETKEDGRYYYLPLERVNKPSESLRTYFDANTLYDICDESNQPIAAATGQEILECMEQLRYGRSEKDREEAEAENQKRTEQQSNKKRYYTYAAFINSRTKKPYRTSLYDENGRRRSNLELLFILAITILQKESGLWDVKELPPDKENNVIYAPRNWKIQNMIDSIYEAREAEIETLGQLDNRLQECGAAYSRARAALRNTTQAKNKMQTLATAIQNYRASNEAAEQILQMENGPEKEHYLKTHKDILDRYRQAKAVMYRYGIEDEKGIQDFESRYEKIGEDILELEERFEVAKEEYRRIKKLEYNVSLAQNAQYCYGPAYTSDKASIQEEIRESDEARNKREAKTEGPSKKHDLDEQRKPRDKEEDLEKQDDK